jgi:hypothetical protein
MLDLARWGQFNRSKGAVSHYRNQNATALNITATARFPLRRLDTKTGEVLGKTAAHHTLAEFVAFLTDLVANQPRGKEIHVIADNLSAH